MQLIRNELEKVNKKINETLLSDFEILREILNYYVQNKGKQLRVLLGILASKIINSEELNDEQIKFLASIELIHNATLIHDDVIDESEIRRNKKTLNKEFGNKLAILAGDYYLSSALNLVINLNNKKLKKSFSRAVKELTEGELSQDLSLFKIPSKEEYTDRIRRKTAILFELVCFGCGLLSDEINEDKCEKLKQFGLNYGIGFQIADDLKNFKNYENKPVQNDYENGIMTLPIIILTQNDEILKEDIENKKYDFSSILKFLIEKNCLDETEKFAKFYFEKAINCLSEFENSEYKKELINLCYSNMS